MDKNRPPNIFDMPNYDLGQKQVAIPIIPEFTQDESESAIKAFAEADDLSCSMVQKVYCYPFMVHCLALPQFSTTAWLQGISVQRIVDQAGVKPSKTHICLELTRGKDYLSGVMYITVESVLYLTTRALEPEQQPIVLIDNMLKQYAKKV